MSSGMVMVVVIRASSLLLVAVGGGRASRVGAWARPPVPPSRGEHAHRRDKAVPHRAEEGLPPHPGGGRGVGWRRAGRPVRQAATLDLWSWEFGFPPVEELVDGVVVDGVVPGGDGLVGGAVAVEVEGGGSG